jgi:hypothetical protein
VEPPLQNDALARRAVLHAFARLAEGVPGAPRLGASLSGGEGQRRERHRDRRGQQEDLRGHQPGGHGAGSLRAPPREVEPVGFDRAVSEKDGASLAGVRRMRFPWGVAVGYDPRSRVPGATSEP